MKPKKMKKLEYKKYMMKGVDHCFDKLYDALSPDSYYYNDIIHLKSRYDRVSKETNKNLISFSEKNLEMDRIQVALLEYIDKLEDEDFSENITSNKSKTEKVENSFNHFWKTFFETKTTVVIGTYYSEKYNAWEASDLIGIGSALALSSILGTLNRTGVKNIDVITTNNFSGDKYKDNLVLVGGPDANILTRETYERLSTNLRFGNPDKNEISLSDAKEKKTYFAKYNSQRQVIGDFGFAFKTPNPFNPDSTAIIIAGCFGFGTFAAAQLFENERLLAKVEGFEDSQGFEALVYADVINDWTQKPQIICSYGMKTN